MIMKALKEALGFIVVLFFVLALVFGGMIGCTTTAQYLPNGPDTVPNHISCQFRGASFCHPKLINT